MRYWTNVYQQMKSAFTDPRRYDGGVQLGFGLTLKVSSLSTAFFFYGLSLDPRLRGDDG